MACVNFEGIGDSVTAVKDLVKSVGRGVEKTYRLGADVYKQAEVSKVLRQEREALRLSTAFRWHIFGDDEMSVALAKAVCAQEPRLLPGVLRMFWHSDIAEPNAVNLVKLRKEKASMINVAPLNALLLEHVKRYGGMSYEVYNSMLSECLLDVRDLETVLLYLLTLAPGLSRWIIPFVTKTRAGKVELIISENYRSLKDLTCSIVTLEDMHKALSDASAVRITKEVQGIVKGVVRWMSWAGIPDISNTGTISAWRQERKNKGVLRSSLQVEGLYEKIQARDFKRNFEFKNRITVDMEALNLSSNFQGDDNLLKKSSARYSHIFINSNVLYKRKLCELIEIALYNVCTIKYWSKIYEAVMVQDRSESGAIAPHAGGRTLESNSCKEVKLAALRDLQILIQREQLTLEGLGQFPTLNLIDVRQFEAVQNMHRLENGDPYDLSPVRRISSSCFASSIITRRNSYIKQLKRHGSIKYQDCCLYTVDSYNVLMIPNRTLTLYNLLDSFESPVCNISLACALRYALSLCRYLNWKQLEWGSSLSDVLVAPWKLQFITDRLHFIELRQFVEATVGSTQYDYLCLLTNVSRAGYKQTLSEVGLYEAIAGEHTDKENRGNRVIADLVTYKSLLVGIIKMTSSHYYVKRVNSRGGSEEMEEWRKEGKEVLLCIGGDYAIKCRMCKDGKARALELIRESSSSQTGLHIVGRDVEIIVK